MKIRAMFRNIQNDILALYLLAHDLGVLICLQTPGKTGTLPVAGNQFQAGNRASVQLGKPRCWPLSLIESDIWAHPVKEGWWNKWIRKHNSKHEQTDRQLLNCSFSVQTLPQQFIAKLCFFRAPSLLLSFDDSFIILLRIDMTVSRGNMNIDRSGKGKRASGIMCLP